MSLLFQVFLVSDIPDEPLLSPQQVNLVLSVKDGLNNLPRILRIIQVSIKFRY